MIGVFTSFFFLYSVLFRSYYLFISGNPGIIKEVLFSFTRNLIIVIAVINVRVFVEFLFSLFFLLLDFSNLLFASSVAGGIDVLNLANDTATRISQSLSDPLSIIYGLSWFVLTLGVVVMGVFYVINTGEAMFYLFIIFPFLCRAGVMGLLLPQTSGWFWTIINLGLEQVFKPFLGKVLLWFTLLLLQVGLTQITSTNVGITSLLAQIAWLLFVVIFGVIMQQRVPGFAKFFAIAAKGTAQSLASSGLAEAAIGGVTLAAGLAVRIGQPLARSASSAASGLSSGVRGVLSQTALAQQGERARANLVNTFDQRVRRPLERGLVSAVDRSTAPVTAAVRRVGDTFAPVPRTGRE
ncbi:hypothetical protein [Anthocerotibacter panamensis]|uniref:hypothetical protein n=1 Tax=Anthocerotibacter panamensis TaxID=2857077 RepID=UPI001C4071C6|nr:hypothetical protein [Anthocerotibacter panamensis]